MEASSSRQPPRSQPGNSGKNIRVNVGGRTFHTTIQTLRSVPGSYFDGVENFLEGEREEIFLDEDPEAFSFVLEYLRFRSRGGCFDLRVAPLRLLPPIRSVSHYLGLEELESLATALMEAELDLPAAVDLRSETLEAAHLIFQELLLNCPIIVWGAKEAALTGAFQTPDTGFPLTPSETSLVLSCAFVALAEGKRDFGDVRHRWIEAESSDARDAAAAAAAVAPVGLGWRREVRQRKMTERDNSVVLDMALLDSLVLKTEGRMIKIDREFVPFDMQALGRGASLLELARLGVFGETLRGETEAPLKHRARVGVGHLVNTLLSLLPLVKAWWGRRRVSLDPDAPPCGVWGEDQGRRLVVWNKDWGRFDPSTGWLVIQQEGVPLWREPQPGLFRGGSVARGLGLEGEGEGEVRGGNVYLPYN